MTSGDTMRLSRDGLTDVEVAERVRLGQTNAEGAPTSRSVGEIVRRNVLTFFNGLLLVMLVAILAFGNARDALFGFVLFLNMAIGIFQELRAKHTLDKLSLLAAPGVRVVRDGETMEIPVAEVVLDDVIELRRGDQIVADGSLLETAGLEIDESLLTGESRPVLKRDGDGVMSGSFCVAGTGRMKATGVGAASYAQRLAAEAKRFRRVPSELRRTTDRILKTIAVALVPVGILLAATRWARTPVLGVVVPETVSGLVGMIPQGLVLLTSIAFAVSVIKLARRRALIEELPAVEILARVDVVCLDKTGTLTEPDLEVVAFETLDGAEEAPARSALAVLAAAEPAESRNATASALVAAFPAFPGAAAATSTVPFSSSRKWSAVTLADGSAWYLGAPDQLLPEGNPARARANELQQGGARVVLLGRSADAIPTTDNLFAQMTPVALVSLEEKVRPDVGGALAYFRDQGVALKVISGDSPVTVAAVVRRAGLEIVGEPADAADLPKSPAALADFMESHTVFGRVKPEDKRDMVAALQSRGHVVAMTGDGVNDVLALKTADLGIAMGTGAPAARAVAGLVLLDGRFSVLPDVLAEGRRVMANIERVANLFVAKSVYAALLAIGAGLLAANYPLMPRHFTLIDALTIGIPGFFLALSPTAPRYRPGLMGRILRFAGVCGVAMTAAAAVAFEWALRVPGVTAAGGLAEARTVAVWTLMFTGLWVLFEVSRPLTRGRVALLASMAAGALVVVYVPIARSFFALPVAPAGTTFVVLGATAAAAAVMDVGLRMTGWRTASRREGAERV
ncbi:MAG TPA: HAD-IC family P-type ATPase [Coriobacteriia bacterium]